MKTDKIQMIEEWTFGDPGGDTCELRVVATGELVKRDIWARGHAPVLFMPGFRKPDAPSATRRFAMPEDELERLRQQAKKL